MEKNPFKKEESDSAEKKDSSLKEAEATLDSLENIDLSTPEGRIDVAQMYFYGYAMKVPRFEGPRGRYSVGLGDLIRLSVTQTGKEKSSIPVVNRENIFHNLLKVMSFYGHNLVKRSNLFRMFITGSDSVQEDMERLKATPEDADKFMYALVLYGSGAVSAEALSTCLANDFLRKISADMKTGNISEDRAKQHPNYKAVEELALKADKQQAVLTDILFKMFSSYLHTGDFKIPSISLNEGDQEMVIKKSKEMEDLFSSKGGHFLPNLTEGVITESINSFSFSPELEAEIKLLIGTIDFFQPLLDKYNSLMEYYRVSPKTE